MDREPSFGGDLAGEFGGSALGVDIYGCGEPFDQATWTIRVSGGGFIGRIELIASLPRDLRLIVTDIAGSVGME